EGRPRAASHDLVLSDGKWHGGDVTITANRYPVYDGTDGAATVSHLNAIRPALDLEMVPRNVERLGIRELDVVALHRLSFPRDGDAPNANWQTGEMEGPGGYRGGGRDPEYRDVENPALRGLHCVWVPECFLGTVKQQVHWLAPRHVPHRQTSSVQHRLCPFEAAHRGVGIGLKISAKRRNHSVRRAGWGPRASARAPTRLVKASAAAKLGKWKTRSSRAMPSRSTSCQPETSRLSSAISASVTRGESRRQATHRSPDSVLIARTSGFLLAGKLRSPDALFGDLHPLDALEAEEQFNEVRRRLGGDPLDDSPERLLHVLAEGDALDRKAAQVHLHALVRFKHARASGRSPSCRSAPRGISVTPTAT